MLEIQIIAKDRDKNMYGINYVTMSPQNQWSTVIY